MHQPTLCASDDEPDAAPRADKRDHAADRRRTRLQIEAGDHFDQMQRVERRHQIFAGAAAHQFAIKLHVVGAADHDHLGRRIADMGEPIEFVERGLAVEARLYDQEVGRHHAMVMIDGGPIPPSWTLRCALESRRSAPARCRAAPVSGNSTKAWMEIRGTGRSCGAAPKACRLWSVQRRHAWARLLDLPNSCRTARPTCPPCACRPGWVRPCRSDP